MEVFKRIKKNTRFLWHLLDRSIYVGSRRENNLVALTFVSIVTTILGIVLFLMNLLSSPNGWDFSRVFMSVVTFLSGAGCACLAHFRKDREKAVLIPTLFCAFVFTFYALTGYGEGTGILWSLLLPIGMSYFVSVKSGLILAAYHSVLYFVVFFTSLGDNLRPYYGPLFMERFPILYAGLSLFTVYAMIQYHRTVLFEIDYTDRLNQEVARQTAVAEERSRKIEEMSLQTIQSLANAIDAKDPYTRGHSTRVSQYSAKLAGALGWSPERITDLQYAAMLHDIGKIGVPDSILNNPKRLTNVEFDIIKSHTTMGGEILKNRFLVDVAECVARSHHERYDGSGYPQGIKGEEIPEEARVVAIADAFDAMNSNRIYRKACTETHIRHELLEGRGKQFDPSMTDAFICLLDRGELKDIQESDAGDNDAMAAPSALLQEVVESFVNQNAAEQIDLVTGILNRTAGEAAIAKSMKEKGGYLVFLDLDNLKKINDLYGHDAGDRALKLTGTVLSESGDDGLCCRLGGDEFLLFLGGLSQEAAGDRVRAVQNAFRVRKKDDPEIEAASLSAGLAMCTPEDTYAVTYSRADKALYHVKQNGKNDLSFYQDDADDFLERKADIHKLVQSIRDSGSYQGAMDVEYRQFSRMYEFVINLEKRFHQSSFLIMVTMEMTRDEAPILEELEKAMYYMEQSIRQTIRNVDVLTRYNQRQFLIILLGTNPEGVEIAMGRIFRGYYKMYGSGSFTPVYAVAS